MSKKRGGVQISVDVAGATPDERKERIAQGVDTGLRIVASNPEMRLQMILGEAYSRYMELIHWLAGELEKDEKKAPGLRLMADKVVRNESVAGLNALGSRDMARIKRVLLADGLDNAPVHDNPQIKHG